MMRKIILLGICVLVSVSGVFAQDKMMAETSPDKMTTKTVTAEEAAKTALKAGGKMPAFTLNDAANKTVSSADLLKQGNLVLVFYRGAWCPYCNLYLKKLQKSLGDIEANGGKLVAISVENPDKSLGVAQKNELEFTVLSDPNLDTARKFGIVYQLDSDTNEKYKSYGLDLVKMNGTAKPELPLSSTYIVNTGGEIVYAFHDPDYKNRAEPSVIIETLTKMKKAMTGRSDGL